MAPENDHVWSGAVHTPPQIRSVLTDWSAVSTPYGRNRLRSTGVSAVGWRIWDTTLVRTVCCQRHKNERQFAGESPIYTVNVRFTIGGRRTDSHVASSVFRGLVDGQRAFTTSFARRDRRDAVSAEGLEYDNGDHVSIRSPWHPALLSNQ